MFALHLWEYVNEFFYIKVKHKKKSSPSKLSICFEVMEFILDEIKKYFNTICYDNIDDYDICSL
jgi:hypothetical protein